MQSLLKSPASLLLVGVLLAGQSALYAAPDARTMRTREDFMLFGPLGEATYRAWAPAAPNDPSYAINQIRRRYGRETGDPEHRGQRMEMWKNYQALSDRFIQPLERPALDEVYDFLREVNPLAAKQLTATPTGLGAHLSDIQAFSRSFYLGRSGDSRFPEVMSDRHARLFTFLAAPLHDALKFLGGRKAQIMPDHEILTGELVKRHFAGQVVAMDGERIKLTAEDAAFVAGVIGDHENIEKEHGRTKHIRSRDPLTRAKALFFLADVLTGVVVPADGADRGTWRFDAATLDKRFVDLYFRHIDLVKGKIFRPEWGLFSIKSLQKTFKVLLENGLECAGTTPGSSVTESLRGAGLEAVQRALDANAARKRSGEGPVFSAEQEARVTKVQKILSQER